MKCPTSRTFLTIALFALAGLLLVACSSKPESSVESFYQAIAKGDTETALTYITFTDVAANDMPRAKRRAEMAIDAIRNKIEANDGLKNIQILESNIDEAGNTGQFKLALTFNNNKQDTTTPIVTIHENGRWKLTESTLLLAAFGNDIGASIKTWIDAILAGDIDEIIGQYSSRTRENIRAATRFIGREYFLRQFEMPREKREEHQAKGGLKAVEVMWLSFDEINNTAEVKVGKFVYNNGDEDIGTTTMKMILENGEWKIGL